MRNIFTLIILSSFFTLTACSEGLSDWAQGGQHQNCDYSDYVSSNIANMTSKDFSVGYCSNKFAVRPPPKSVAARTGTYDSLSADVNHKSERVFGKLGDSCRDSGFTKSGSRLGDTFPLLSDNDLKDYQICDNPNYEIKYPDGSVVKIRVYQIVERTQACPAGSAPYDQYKAGCI